MYNQKNHQFKTFYNHKFGFHLSAPQREACNEALKLRPKVLKTLDFSVDFLSRVRLEQPDTFIIGRLFVHPQEFGRTASDAQRRGVQLAERILRLEINRHSVAGQRIFNAWESLNEMLPEHAPDDQHKLYDEFQVAFGRRLRSAGFEAIGFNFATGNGRGEQWLRLYPGTLETYTYLGFHEYDWPELDRLHRLGLAGPVEPEHRVPAVGAGRGNDGMWRCLRYRRIMHEGIRQKYGDRHTVIITECGMTQGVWGGASKDIGPWAKALTVPPNIPGGVAATPIPADDYWRSLQWYNHELMRDDYVMGACLFVTGAGSPEWESFEHVNVITTRIFAFQQELKIEVDGSIAPQPGTGHPALDQPALDENEPVGGLSLPEQPPGDDLPDPQDDSRPVSPEARWRYTLKTGAGMGLLVGDIGVKYEAILITKPDGRTEQVISGHKPEYGPGGFETYAQQPGRYRFEFFGQQFDLDLDGHFTRITFEPVPPDEPPSPPVEPPDLPTEIIDPLPEPGPAPDETAPPPVEPAPPPDQPTGPPVEPEPATWRYEIQIGSGLGLLVGDMGLPGVPIGITKPDGRTERLISGHKPEYGPGGFETYALKAGPYRVEFLDQVFTLTLSGQFTRVTFQQSTINNEQLAINNEQLVINNEQPPPLQPSNLPPSTLPHSSPPSLPLPPLQPSTLPPSTLPPSTLPPSTLPPSTLPPFHPSNLPTLPPPSSLPAFQPSSLPPLPPSPPPPLPPSNYDWTYTLQLGAGLGLLIGDLGLAEVVITVIRPDNRRDQVVSGSKPEHGVGGFELEAWEPGTYTLEFLGRRFHLNLLGRITRVTFHQVPRPVGAPASLIAAARERDPLLVVRGEEEISPEVESQRSFFNSLLTILTRWFNKNKSAAE